MMMNMFSTFDPLLSNPIPMKLMNNWYSLILPIMMIPMVIYMKKSINFNLIKMILLNNLTELQYNMKKTSKTSMLILSIFMWILLNNTTSLLPYIFPANTHIAITLTLAIMVVAAIDLYSYLKMLKTTIIKLMPMNVPLILAPFMVIIELISNNIRAFTLTIRLTANILAGHIILSIIMNATAPIIFSSFLILPQIPILMMEMMMAYIQAYVFMTLISLYSSSNTN